MQTDFENHYHDLEAEHFWFVSRRRGIAQLIKNLDLPRDASILDMGCSSGRMISKLNSMGYKNVTGIDISPTAIKQCRARQLHDTHVMDGAAPDLPSKHYDFIIASDVLEHIEDSHGALKNWKQLLRVGGKAAIFVPAYEMLWSVHDEVNQHHRRYTRQNLTATLEKTGFNVIQSGYWNTALLFPVLLARPLQRMVNGIKPRMWKHTDEHLKGMCGDLGTKPPRGNRFLTWLLTQENRLLKNRIIPPCGVSTYAVVSRPAAAVKTVVMNLFAYVSCNWEMALIMTI